MLKSQMWRVIRVLLLGLVGGTALSLCITAFFTTPDGRAALKRSITDSLSEFFAESFPSAAERRALAKGRSDAAKDIAKGSLTLRVYGLRNLEYDELWSNGLSELDVTLDHYAGCVVDDVILAELQGYNEVVEAELSRRFGPDALQEVSDRTMLAYQQRTGTVD
jgi:hypothetical protein